jgi:hypothetical protein
MGGSDDQVRRLFSYVDFEGREQITIIIFERSKPL